MSNTPEQLHNALCGALGTPAWRFGMSDGTKWQGFLSEMRPLEEAGGPLSSRDVINVVNLMRKQRAKGTPWSLRYSAIMRQPETFRDLVFETRRAHRPPPKPERIERTMPDGARVLDEGVPEHDAVPIRQAAREELARFRKKLRHG